MNIERVEKVVAKHIQLLKLEESMEKEEQEAYIKQLGRRELQEKGVALFNMQVDEQRTGMGGKTIFQFRNPMAKLLPLHKFKVGDMARVDNPKVIFTDENAKIPAGVVSKVTESTISVAFEVEFPDAYQSSIGLRILKMANDIAFRRATAAMEDLLVRAKKNPSPIIDQVFGPSLESPTLYCPKDSLKETTQSDHSSSWHNLKLNEPQRLAVLNATNSAGIRLIHGPPGTGKTETLVEIIRQLISPLLFKQAKPKKVLVCGPSNLSVDNLVERLVGINMARIGHPARILDSVQQHSLDQKILNSDDARLVSDMRNEIELLFKNLSKPGTNRRETYAMIKDLRKELKQREKQLTARLLDSCQVVLCTLNMAGGSILKDRAFDVVIIDEAGQALEAETWIALLKAERAVLAGDHLQLPPTISSAEAGRGGLGVSLFERMCSKLPKLVNLLNIQYRMNKCIMDWSSQEFYQGKLIADGSVAEHTVAEFLLPTEVLPSSLIENADVMVFVDTSGYDYNEALGDDDDSKFNDAEAKIVIAYLREFINIGLAATKIAVITPYNAQVTLIKRYAEESSLPTSIEIGSGSRIHKIWTIY